MFLLHAEFRIGPNYIFERHKIILVPIKNYVHVVATRKMWRANIQEALWH